MTIYMVERNLKGIEMAALATAQQAAITKAAAMRECGSEIRYIRSTFVPDEGRCMCLFEAASPDIVRKLNDEANIPYERVVEALDLVP